MNLLEGPDLKALGHNSAEYIHANVEAVKLAFADRDTYLGDTDFIRIPFEGLLSKDYARERGKLIDPNKASLEFRPGQPGSMQGLEPIERPIDIDFPGRQTTKATRATLLSSTKNATCLLSRPACTMASESVW